MEEKDYSLKEDLNELHRILDKMNDYQRKQSSLRWNFWRGVFYGFGFFIGSVLLVAVLLYLLNRLGGEGDNFLTQWIRKIVEVVQQYRD